MKKMFLLAGIFATALFTFSCSKEESKKGETYLFKNTEKVEVLNVKSAKEITVSEQQPKFEGYQKYSFSKNTVVESDQWDIAFNGYTIIVNGGTSPNADKIAITGKGALYITEGTLENVTSVELEKLKNHTVNYTDWGQYGGGTHMVTPIAGKIIVIKTYEGQYVKMRIDSFYKDKGDQKPGANYKNTELGYYSFTFIKG
ncbi:HmuY family protein [Capnocytophaga canimorsus]|uniref:HmuY family protein n=1 Tax=Capnocytophaga canimorsus TaxID=28188 RepID=UPI0037D40971